MTPTKLRRLSSPLWPLVLGCIVFLAGLFPAAAQPANTGIVTGRVFNPITKEYVRNAEVRVAGTDITATSEDDGSYRLLNVPVGAATVSVNYTGYETATSTVNV